MERSKLYESHSKEIDAYADAMSKQLDVLGHVANNINTSIEDQDKKLDHISIQMDKTKNNIDHATNQTTKLLKFMSNNKPYYICIIFSILLLVILIIVYKYT